MPELIECRVMAEKLRAKLVGLTLTRLTIKHPDKFKESGKLVLPNKVTAVDSYGKKIFFQFANGQYLVTAPLMDGRWLFEEGDHTKVIFHFDESKTNIFYDISRFGGPIEIIDDPYKFIQRKKLGPDPYSVRITATEFRARFRKSTQQKHKISKVLLDQSVIAGVGNWMKAECLYEAKISPHRLMSDVTDQEIETLRVKLNEIIRVAYLSNGLTVHSFWSPDGKAGTYPRKVYSLTKDPYGNDIVHEPSKGNIRSNFWVPKVQT